jgi:hypothetical protein
MMENTVLEKDLASMDFVTVLLILLELEIPDLLAM